MTAFDIIVLLIAGIAAVGGFMRGFVQEVLSLAAWVLAVFAIRYLHPALTDQLQAVFSSETSAAILAFALLLLVPYAAMKLIAGRAGGASRNSVLGPIDRLLGFGFGSIKGLIIVVLGFSVLVLGYDTVWGPGGRPDWITQSRSYPFINAASDELVQMIADRRRASQEAGARKAIAERP
jgi:membrane protein required for colicin V production